jgi:SAM-dependent methyltransferase
MNDARSAWDAAAGSWGNAPGSSRAVTNRMVELAAPVRGECVLELACGTGEAGIATALAIGGDVELVLSDFSPEMVAAALAAAHEAGLEGARGRELDLESIDEPDSFFDLVLCRMGIMLVADPIKAAREITRILRPGGRAVVAVWGPRERNPWLRVVFERLGELWGVELPAEEGPSPFALDRPDRLRGVLEQAGLVDCEVEEVEAPLAAASHAEWWDKVATGDGPLGQLVGSLPEHQRRAIRAEAIEAIRPEFDGGRVPRSALVAIGRRADPKSAKTNAWS